MYEHINASINASNLLINYEMLRINNLILQSNLERNEEIIKLLKEIRDNGNKRNI